MTTLIVYHKNCMDGLGAAYAASMKFGFDDVEYVAMQYGEAVPDFFGKDVYFLDFSLKKDAMREVCNFAKSVTVIDHHKTAYDDLWNFQADNYSAVWDMEKSGAVLAWNHFFSGVNPPKLLQHIQDRDLWHFKIEDTKIVHAWLKCSVFGILDMEAAVNHFEHAPYVPSSKGMPSWRLIGLAVLRHEGQMIKSCISKPRPVHFDVFDFGEGILHTASIFTFNCPGGLASDACAALMQERSVELVASYFDTDTHRVFSLRSSPGVDCSLIAKYYGGGGHPQASGFSVPRDHQLAKV